MARHFPELLAVRQVAEHLAVAIKLRNDLFEGQVLVERHADMSNMAHLDIYRRSAQLKSAQLTLLVSIDDLLQEVHRDICLRRQVDSGLNGQERVYLALRTVLGRKLSDRYDLAATRWDL